MRGVGIVLFDYDDTLVDVGEAREFARRVVAGRISSLTGVGESVVLDVVRGVESRMESLGLFDRRVWFWRVVAELGVELGVDLINELVRVYWDSWSSRSRLFPETLPVLRQLRACGYRLGMVTNTDGEPGLKRDRLRRDGVYDFFDLIIVAGDDTEHVKPHPEPFLKALRVLGVEGREAVYVGDRVSTDVPGAKAVGMYAVIVDRSGSLGIDDLGGGSRPDFIISSLLDLPQILGCNG
ncbi:haloacid dehalogenase [Vulcanisaeta souniana JCM 11219]|uniref:Haloacid dehalogenase n=2 Tax=Vulcanisaeta souniana TaxID=164452 RepID=A0A830EM87_9CREN|nr:haloacid dehalogenase [Vulcanisaeta souniana JCM 11219]GGI84766.1 haloacid dehalogenase [Vulcanisaeta souniana JCM 11219]